MPDLVQAACVCGPSHGVSSNPTCYETSVIFAHMWTCGSVQWHLDSINALDLDANFKPSVKLFAWRTQLGELILSMSVGELPK